VGPKQAIIHAETVADPRLVAVVLEQLGVDEVKLSLRRAAGDDQVRAIVAAIPADLDAATLRFIGGSLEAVDVPALAATAPGSLSLHTRETSLHLWPVRAAVTRREPLDASALAQVAAIVGEAELRPGATTVNETTITLDPGADGSIGHLHGFDLVTSDRGIALEVFAAISSHTLDRGWLTRPSQASLDALPGFIAGLGEAQLELDMILTSVDATDLALEAPGDMRLDSPIVSVRFPDGELSGRIEATDEAETSWRLRVGDAVSVSKFHSPAPETQIE